MLWAVSGRSFVTNISSYMFLSSTTRDDRNEIFAFSSEWLVGLCAKMIYDVTVVARVLLCGF